VNTEAIARAVRDAGGRALVVGGWVRDRLMGLAGKDVDVEVFGVPADRLREILSAFGSVNAVGESFTVYKVGDVDVSLPRTESKTGRGHKGFTVTGDPSLPVKEAARRRDFTINAIAFDPLTGEYIDPFDGRGDLARRLLRAVVERLFPELDALVGCPQEPEWHPEGDVWIHTLLVIDQARARLDDLPYPQQVALMLGAVCHDLGKPATTAFIDGRIRSLDHEEQGVPPATALLDRLNVHSLQGFDVRREVLGLVANHLKPGMFAKADPPAGDGAYRRLAQKVDLQLLARVAKADCEGRGGGFDCSAMDRFAERARALGVEHAPPEPLVKGRHLVELGVAPGPALGEVLRDVYERQLDGAASDFDAAFALAQKLARERRLY
jgi:tRNA nucleotidyltransferase (CCA-adding enzyme)